MTKFKNVFLLAAMAVSAGFVGCDKENEEGTGDPAGGSFDGVITATVSTGGVSVDTVKAMAEREIDEFSVEDYAVAIGAYKDGKFTLTFPKTVTASGKIPFADEEGVTVNPETHDCIIINSIYAYSGATKVGEFFYKAEPNTAQTVKIENTWFTYVDRDVSMTGSHSSTTENFITTYNASLKAGWNRIYQITRLGTGEITTTNTSGLSPEWVFEPTN
ncbi:hypothetical protein AGMMS49982_15720 [Bacteroidia bacterium]|nr:hypothetical protein AGMMS49982_15720 [Bacteroidia bacterium]